jgi:hypothetical protein
MRFSSFRSSSAVALGLCIGCVLILWTLRAAPAQAPEPKAKHTYTLYYLKLPAADGEVAALSACKSVSVAAATHAGEPQLAALCER